MKDPLYWKMKEHGVHRAGNFMDSTTTQLLRYTHFVYTNNFKMDLASPFSTTIKSVADSCHMSLNV
jgi:hypothetical protein